MVIAMFDVCSVVYKHINSIIAYGYVHPTKQTARLKAPGLPAAAGRRVVCGPFPLGLSPLSQLTASLSSLSSISSTSVHDNAHDDDQAPTRKYVHLFIHSRPKIHPERERS
jgi:hypothetical protein